MAKLPQLVAERLEITKLIPGGQALATMADGKKLFLWNALPGEIVTEFQLTKNKSHFAEGIATKFEQTSPERIAPRDTCYLATSPWQILNYDYELSEKRALLLEIFRQHQIILSSDFTVKTDGHDFYYRNKMEYALYYDHETAQIFPAFHSRGSHRKIPITSSSLERPEIWQRATEIIAELNLKQVDARRFQSLLLRCNQAGEVSGGLLENHQPHPVFAPLEDEILGHKYSYSPNGFFQINLPAYELALQEIQKYITTTKVLDLYAGVGTIGLSVARDRELTLVECDKSAYQELEANCQNAIAENGLPEGQVKPVLAKSEEALEYIAPDQTVIVDPPRAGCDHKLLEKLLEVLPPTIIYLSCNPATQARDVAKLQQSYSLSHIQPYNFFPRTPHLENLVVLERQ